MICAHVAAACLVLARSDLPRGFAGGLAEAHAVSNAEAARGAPAGFELRLEQWRRTGGYRAEFSRAATATGLQQGPLEILSSASVYRSAAGAKAAFAYTRRHLVPAGIARLALGFKLGDEAREYVTQAGSAVGALLEYTVVWRDGRVNASLIVIGRVGVVSAADLVPLARAQERRIQRARRPSGP